MFRNVVLVLSFLCLGLSNLGAQSTLPSPESVLGYQVGADYKLATYDETVARYWRGRIEKFTGVVIERLEKDRAAGLVAEDLDIPYTAHWIVWGTERSIAQHVAAGRTDDDRLAASIARSTWWSVDGG